MRKLEEFLLSRTQIYVWLLYCDGICRVLGWSASPSYQWA